MAAEEFRIIFTDRAEWDLDEIVEHWYEQGEPARGFQYSRDLPNEAIRLLSNPSILKTGKFLKHSKTPEVQAISVFNYSYQILYEVDDLMKTVHVLRFWHSHRKDPFA